MRRQADAPGHGSYRRTRAVRVVTQALLGTLVAALPALLFIGLLQLFGVQSGTSVPILLVACMVVGIVHARRHGNG